MLIAAYLPADRRRALVEGYDLPDRTTGAALFADISGFTPLTEALTHELGPRLGAEELTHHLNRVYDALIAEVNRHGGSVVFFSGDAITCWFDESLVPGPLSFASAGTPDILDKGQRTNDTGQRTALQAVACALALQQAMSRLAQIRTPAGQAFSLELKVAVASGPARRFVVGDPAAQCRDALAGATLDRLAAAEHLAHPGEVVASAEVVAALEARLTIEEWRADEETGERFAVLRELKIENEELRTGLSIEDADSEFTIHNSQFRPWLLPAVYERLAAGHNDMPIELRPATALLLGFGGLDYDGDAMAGAKLDRYVRWVQQVLARYGGTLIDLTIGDKGSYLYLAFGAPTAHENDAERALRAALELLTPPAELSWVEATRIGISHGTMRTGAYGGAGRLHYGALGDAVNTAARLMTAAPGQIFVSHSARQPCTDLFLWDDMPPLTVKGKAAPLKVFRLIEGREQAARDFYQSALVGRESELARLLAAARPIFAGQFAGICYVAGEAGIGKSRLVYELRRRLAAEQPIQWLYCPTDDVLRGSLHPFAHLLRGYFGQSTLASEAENKASFDARLDELATFLTKDEGRRPNSAVAPEASSSASVHAPALAAELERTRSFLGAMVGLRWEGSLYEQLDPKLRFENTLYAVVNLIRAESFRQPVLIELEDGHWLDADSQELIATLSRALAGYPVALVCAARPDDDGRPYRLGLAEGTPECAVDLETLSPEGCRILAAQTLGEDVSDELARYLFDKTGGNPFFAEQLALDLRERGLLENQEPPRGYPPVGSTENREAGRDYRFSVLDSRFLHEVPAGINAVLVARIDRLAAPVKEVVQTASVLGREWPLQVLWEMLRDDRSLPGKVRQAEQGQVWAHMGEMRYLFRHVLLRDAAYDMQARSRLRELHARAAMAIEAEYAGSLAPQYANLAYHYEQAAMRQETRRYLELAADQARESYRNHEALALYDRLLGYLDDRTKIISATNRKAAILELIGEAAEAERLYEESVNASKEQGALALLAKSLVGLSKMLDDRGQSAEAVSLLEESAKHYTALEDWHELGRVQAQLASLYRQLGDAERALSCFQQALQLAEMVDDRHGRSLALRNLGGFWFMRSDLSQGMEYSQRALAIAEELQDIMLIGPALNSVAAMFQLQGNYAEAITRYQRALSLANTTGNLTLIAKVAGNMGVLYASLGSYSEALVNLHEMARVGESTGSPDFMAFAFQEIGVVHQRMGDYARAEDFYDRASTLSRQAQNPSRLCRSLYSKANLFFLGHRIEEASALNADALQIARQFDQMDIVFGCCVLNAKLAALNNLPTAVTELEALLHEHTGDDEVAAISYELFKLTGDASYRETSAELYRALWAQTPNIEYKERLAELETAKSNSVT